MKTKLSLFFLFLNVYLLSAQQSAFDQVFAPTSAFCTANIEYRVTISNIDVVTTPMPLTGTKVILTIKNENGDSIHHQTVEGPNIAPGNFHVFIITVPAGTFEEDGNYKAQVEFEADIDENTNTISPEFNLKIQLCGIGLSGATQRMQEYLETNEELGINRVGYIYPEKIKAGTMVSSFNSEEFNQVLSGDVFIGWAISDPHLDFEQPAKLMVLNTFPAVLNVFDINWWSVIDGEDWIPTFDEDPIFGEVSFDDGENPPVEFEEQDPIPNPKTCAILVSGRDKTVLKNSIFQSDVEIFKQYLKGNIFGPKLPESQIKTLHGSGNITILEELQNVSTGYDKIYFYYRGHGNKDGKICSGNSPQEWTSHEEIADILLNSEAKDICILMDCCYSGNLIDIMENDFRSCTKNIEILTSTTGNKQSATVYQTVNNVPIGGFGFFSYSFFNCSIDIRSDKNFDGIISFNENFEWILEIDPELQNTPISEFQCPQSFNPENCQMNLEQAAEIFRQFIESEVNLSENQVAYLYETLIGAGTEISSFYEQEYKDTTNIPYYFSMVIQDPNSIYSQEVIYLYLDPQTGEISSVNSSFWPVINGVDFYPFPGTEIYNPVEPDQGDIPEATFEGEEQVNTTKTCAIIVSGYHQEDQSTLPNATQSFKQNLIRNPYGPQLSESQIIILNQKGKNEIKAEIEKIKTGYDSIYFYYVGHGYSGKGAGTLGPSMCTKIGSDSWYEFKELAEDLLSTDATAIKIIMDCCWAGNIIDEIKANPKNCSKNVEIITSSTTDKTGRFKRKVVNGEKLNYWVFSSYLNPGSGDPTADTNVDGKITLEETYNWLIKNDPYYTDKEPSFVTLTCPQYYNNGITINKQMETAINLLEEQGNLEMEKSEVIFNYGFSNERTIKQHGNSEFEYNIQAGEQFGWVNNNAEEFFPKNYNVFKIKYNEECQEAELDTLKVFNGLWPNDPAVPNIFNQKNKIYIPPDSNQIVQNPPTIDEDEAPVENACAILISGFDPRSKFQDAFDNSVDYVEEKYTKEDTGPNIKSDMVHKLYQPSAEELQNLIQSIPNDCTKIYFYFVGNGNLINGPLLSEENPNEMSYQQVYELLAEIGAEDYCILIDDGKKHDKISDDVSNSNIKFAPNLSIVTSSFKNHDGFYTSIIDQNQGISYFTYRMMAQFRKDENDVDMDGKISFREAKIGFAFEGANTDGFFYNSTYKTYFNSIESEIIMPDQSIVKVNNTGESFLVFSSHIGSFTFSEDWLKMHEIPITQFRRVESDDYRSPLTGDLYLKYNPDIDSISSNSDFPVIAFRDSEESPWQLIENTSFDESTMLVLAEEIELQGDFIIVGNESSTPYDEFFRTDFEIDAQTIVESDLIQLSLNMEKPVVMDFLLYDLSGHLIQKINNQFFPQGISNFEIKIGDLPANMYILNILSKNQNVLNYKIIKI